ncbi:hypothetical protein [Azospirillum largimobile]
MQPQRPRPHAKGRPVRPPAGFPRPVLWALAHRKAVRSGERRCGRRGPDGDPSRCRASRRRPRRRRIRTRPVRRRREPRPPSPAPSSGTSGPSCPPSRGRRRSPSTGPATGPGSGAPAIRRKADRMGDLVATGRPWADYKGGGAGLTSAAWLPT